MTAWDETDREAAGPEPAPPSGLLRLLTWTRLLVLVGVASIFAGSLALFLLGALRAYALAAGAVGAATGAEGSEKLILDAVKLVDIVLLAVVLFITAAALFELFISPRLPLPPWLRVQSIDGLKHKLVVVVITVLAVEFLGQVIAWHGDATILSLGGGIAAVIAALSYFLSVRSGKS